MNILLITQLYPLSKNSESSSALHYFAKEWVKNHNVQVIRPLLSYESEKLEENRREICIDNVKISVVKPIWIPIVKKALINRRSIVRLIDNQPDVIICHLYNSYLTFGFLKKKYNAAFVIGIHKSDANLVKNTFHRIRVKNAIKIADLLAYRSLSVKKQFENSIKTDKSSFIANSGIPQNLIDKANSLINKAESISYKEFKIISVAQLIPLKQIDKVLKVISKVSQAKIDLKYTVVGDGKERNRLKQIINQQNLSEIVSMTGNIPREEVFELLEKSNLFILPSYNETFGLVYLEAMASGCIVIGSKGWGIDGIIQDGVNGFLCNPYSDEDIEDTIKCVLQKDESELNLIRKNSLQTVLQYSDRAMANHYIENINKYVRK